MMSVGRGALLSGLTIQRSKSLDSADSLGSRTSNGETQHGGRLRMSYDRWNCLRMSLHTLTRDNYKFLSPELISQLQTLLLHDLDFVEPVLLLIYETAYKCAYSYPIAARLFEDIGNAKGRIGDHMLDEIQDHMQRHLSNLQDKLRSGRETLGIDVGIVYLLLNLCKLDLHHGGMHNSFKVLLVTFFEKLCNNLKLNAPNAAASPLEFSVIISLVCAVGCFLLSDESMKDRTVITDISSHLRKHALKSTHSPIVLSHILHFLETVQRNQHMAPCWCQNGCFSLYTSDKWMLSGAKESLQDSSSRKLSIGGMVSLFHESSLNTKNADETSTTCSSPALDKSFEEDAQSDSGADVCSIDKVDSTNDSTRCASGLEDVFQSDESELSSDRAISASPSEEKLSEDVPSQIEPMKSEVPLSNDNSATVASSVSWRQHSPPPPFEQPRRLERPWRSMSVEEGMLNTSIRSISPEEQTLTSLPETVDESCVSELITIPAMCYSRVIGYQGASIRKIEAESGATLKTNSDELLRPETTSLTAHRFITTALGVPTDMDNDKLALEKEKIAAAKVACSFTKGKEKVIKIIGNEDQISQAKQMIDAIVRDSHQLNCSIPIMSAAEFTDLLGLKLQSIEDLLSVSVEPNSDENGCVSLDIFGDMQSCKDAKSLILEHLSSVSPEKGLMVAIPEWILALMSSGVDINKFADQLSRMCSIPVRIFFANGKPHLFLSGFTHRISRACVLISKLNTKLLTMLSKDTSKPAFSDNEDKPLAVPSVQTVDVIPNDEKLPTNEDGVESSCVKPDVVIREESIRPNVIEILRDLDSDPVLPLAKKGPRSPFTSPFTKDTESPSKKLLYSKDDLLSCFHSPTVKEVPSWFPEIESCNDQNLKPLLVHEGHGPSVLASLAPRQSGSF